MNFSEFFIKRTIATILLVVALVLFGIFAYFKLPVSNLPSVNYPVITIWASYPGANPEIMASKIATPLEQQCMQISGLQNVISKSTDGDTQITLNFDAGENVDLQIPEVQAAIQRAKANMPKLPEDPTFYKENPSDFPIVQYAFYSETLNKKALYDLVNRQVAAPLRLLQGISNVDIYGTPYAIRIKLEPDRMAAYDITMSDVKNTITNGNLMLTAGGFRDKYSNLSINPAGQLTTPKAYNNLIIKYNSGNPVFLKEIGRAYDSVENENAYLKLNVNGKDMVNNVVLVTVFKKPGANTIQVADSTKALINKIKKGLPSSIYGAFLFDLSKTVRETVNEVKETLISAFLLIICVMFLFFGRVTDTIIPGIVIPVTILMTCIVMYFTGFSIDNLSLLAIILAMGFIVDDSIVVLENTIRHIEKGITPYNASVKSSKEVAASVVSMTVSIIVVFIPIVFMPGIVGKTFKEFALVVITMVFCSGIISLSLTPMMNAHMLNPVSKQRKSRILKISNAALEILIKKYSAALKLFLKRPYLSLIIWLLCIFFSLFFYYDIPKSFIPPGDSGFAWGAIMAPPGNSTEQMQKYQNYIYDILKKNPNIACSFTYTGKNSSIDQSEGEVSFVLKPEGEREPINQVIQEVKKQISKIPYNLGAVYLTPIPVLMIDTGGTTGATGSQYSYLISGTDEKEVNSCALKLTDIVKKEPGFTDVQNNVQMDMPQVKVKILREKASQLGISVAQIENALADAFSWSKVSDYTEGSQQYNVYLQAAENYSKSASALSVIELRSSITNELVPLSTLVKLKKTTGPKSVTHYNQLNTATVSFSLSKDTPLSTAVEKINKLAAQIIPPSITGSFEGTASQFLSSLKTLGILIFISIFLLYIALGIQYESYIHPFIVLTTLPTATVGGLGFLMLCHSELSLFAYIGMFMLIGLVVKNGIMMVDFALQNIRNDNVSAFDAIHNACITRFRPILMTGLTSIVAAIPIAIGIGSNAELRRPLGLMVIGGLLVSQLVTLFVTPGFFIYMQKFQEKHLDKYRLTRSHKTKVKTVGE